MRRLMEIRSKGNIFGRRTAVFLAALLPLVFMQRSAFLSLSAAGMVMALLLGSGGSFGQAASVWSGATTAGSVRNTAAKKVDGIQKWKRHLEQWGLDSTWTHSLSLCGRLNSDGWSGGLSYKHRRNSTAYTLWQLTFSEIKGEKEAKQQRANTAFPELGASSSYIFGKVNNLYTLQLGYGRERLLLPGVVEGNISVGIRYGGGFSLAMLKPYYLRLVYVDNSTQPVSGTERDERYSDANSSLFLDPSFILGRYRWSKGLGEMTYVPGIYGHTALVIEPAKGKTFIQTVTLGISAAVYSRKLTIMAEQKASAWEGCLFAGLELGKRWK